MTVPVWLVVLSLFVIAALALIVWSVKRRARPHLRLRHFDDPAALMQSIAGFTQSTLSSGNRVELLQNGAFFDRLFADLQHAEKSISFETFLTKEGEVTRRFADLLSAKAKEGIDVRLMLDGSGGRTFGKDSLKGMAESGCVVRMYNSPFRVRNLGKINNRTHRKIAVIDGLIGYVGGHCLTDNWLGKAEEKNHFRDITARVEGPVVAQLQSAFIENWMQECGEVPAGPGVFPLLDRAGDVEAHVVYLSPSGNPSAMKVLHYAAIHAARRRGPSAPPAGPARAANASGPRRAPRRRIARAACEPAPAAPPASTSSASRSPASPPPPSPSGSSSWRRQGLSRAASSPAVPPTPSTR